MDKNAPVNEVVRVLSQELAQKDERVAIGTTHSEKEVLQKHASIGKQRGVMGFIGGAAAAGGVFKYIGGQRRLFGGITMLGGGFFGFTYGMLSIRRELFLEILSLPADRSPFAEQARAILDKKMPNNEFYLEVQERFKKQEAANGSWDASPAFPALPKPSHDDFGGDATRTQTPPTTAARLPRVPAPLPKPVDEPFTNDPNVQEDAQKSSSKQIMFFFGGPPPSPAAEEEQGDRKPTTAPESTHDHHDGYFSWDNESEEEKQNKQPPKPTSWEELRKRAAGGK